ncbi:MAG TPA: IclR family transcriptional regulator [Solirubrobacteraceae bacterium]|nr:IclR family transcriptional regulator [Solirubrobacteraceae bacterium]
MPGDGSSSLRRGLRALEVLANAGGPDDPGLGVVDVARRLGVDKSQASRTLRTLAEHGLVERDPATRAYRLGPRVFAYASLVAERRLLREAPPVLAGLVASLGERAHLSVLDGASVLTLHSESPPHAVQAAGWAGRTVPAYCTAAGRALLADHDADAQSALLARTPLERLAPNTVTDLDELAHRIAATRERGWAVADEELEPGLAAVAAPVRRFDGRIVAALNVSGPSFRFAPRLDEAGAVVAAAAARLSARLQNAPSEVAAAAT